MLSHYSSAGVAGGRGKKKHQQPHLFIQNSFRCLQLIRRHIHILEQRTHTIFPIRLMIHDPSPYPVESLCDICKERRDHRHKFSNVRHQKGKEIENLQHRPITKNDKAFYLQTSGESLLFIFPLLLPATFFLPHHSVCHELTEYLYEFEYRPTGVRR